MGEMRLLGNMCESHPDVQPSVMNGRSMAGGLGQMFGVLAYFEGIGKAGSEEAGGFRSAEPPFSSGLARR
jgi:hypothetical protein